MLFIHDIQQRPLVFGRTGETGSKDAGYSLDFNEEKRDVCLWSAKQQLTNSWKAWDSAGVPVR